MQTSCSRRLCETGFSYCAANALGRFSCSHHETASPRRCTTSDEIDRTQMATKWPASVLLLVGCVKKCEQSLVFFCVVTLPEGQRRLGVYPRPVPGGGNRV